MPTDPAPEPPRRPRPRAKPVPRHLPFLTLLLLILVAVYAIQGPVRSWLSGRYRAVATVDRALDLIVDEYAEPVRPAELVPGAIQGMVHTLRESFGDPHSRYLPPEENRRQESAERGKFAGIGIAIRLLRGRCVVHKVLPNSPAQEAGLQTSDVILAADGQELTGLESLGKAVRAITGPVGTEVTLTVQRGERRLTLTATRRELAKSIVEHRRLAGGLGYLRIAEFPDDVADPVRQALRALRSEPPIRGLVLDLRDNEGGFLDEAVSVADLFLPGGLVVATRCRHPGENRSYHAQPGGPAESLPLVVLVDGQTASAAEVVAGALQDHGRARLVGTKTFGKGFVNKRFSLPTGSGLLLTTGKYFLPSGRQIEGQGIEPDGRVAPPTREELERVPPGAEPPDPQLDEAVRLLTEQLAPEDRPDAPE